MERTANIFDLRFVPEGMEFPEGPGEAASGEKAVEGGWRDECRGEEVSSGKGAKSYKGVDWRTDVSIIQSFSPATQSKTSLFAEFLMLLHHTRDILLLSFPSILSLIGSSTL